MPSQQHTGAPGMMIPGTYQAEKYRVKLILPGISPLSAQWRINWRRLRNSGRISYAFDFVEISLLV